MKFNLDNKMDLVKFMLVVLALTFIFCLVISSQFNSINGRLMKLLEYQTKVIGQGYDPEEVKTPTTTYTPTTTLPTNKYQNY